eukprot:TRINITY_DN16836_c0_g1_i10.p1 TRINITY_DN16836_c0_g1~~TRINITY_DN16836_c0_g1_i10.p1  ORF type:complete len:126 (+),score=24.99 TRINITY_DN16836_c0_g1_i10:32-379(+)
MCIRDSPYPDFLTEANSSLASPYHCEEEIETRKVSIGTGTEVVQESAWRQGKTCARGAASYANYGVVEKAVQTSFRDTEPSEDVPMEDVNPEVLPEAETSFRINTILEDDVRKKR